MDLIPISTPKDFRFVSFLSKEQALTASEKAFAELIQCVDEVWAEFPIELQDFVLRFFKSSGIPLDYPELPFWAHKAAHHLFTVCYPTLRKSDFRNPTTEDFGRVVGHLWAMIRHAKARTSVLEKFGAQTANEIRAFLLKLERPVLILINEGVIMPPHESEKFLAGMNHAYKGTFDFAGLPQGWNTTSRVYLGVCLSWRLIATHAMPFKPLHHWLEKTFGKQEIGSEERVKKVFDRMGLKFDEPKIAKGTSQETIEISAVRGLE